MTPEEYAIIAKQASAAAQAERECASWFLPNAGGKYFPSQPLPIGPHAVAVFYRAARYLEPKLGMRIRGCIWDRKSKSYINHWPVQPGGKT